MDTTQDNKRRERLQIEQFLKLLGYPQNEIQYPKADPPDAFIQSKDGRISIEHTRIIQDKERPIETIREKCIRKAKTSWAARELPFVRLDILFDAAGPDTYKQINQYANYIQDLVFNFAGPLHHLKSKICSNHITCHAALSMPGSRNHWSCINNHIGWVKIITDSKILDTICKKNDALQRYKRKYSESWLLLFVESEYASGMFHLETKHEHESDFDKIYISDGFKYVEIHKRQEI